MGNVSMALAATAGVFVPVTDLGSSANKSVRWSVLKWVALAGMMAHAIVATQCGTVSFAFSFDCWIESVFQDAKACIILNFFFS